MKIKIVFLMKVSRTISRSFAMNYNLHAKAFLMGSEGSYGSPPSIMET